MHFSAKIIELLRGVANDPEFAHDHNLKDNSDSFLTQVLNDPKLLKIALQSNLSDYDHDIAMEEEAGEDAGYLKPTRDELLYLLNQVE